jgi:nucleoside-triphosphatase
MSSIRVFLTGEPGCGKTTVIREITRIINAKGMKAGGVISGEIRRNGVRVGFSLEGLETDVHGTLAHVERADGPRVGMYRVNLADIERVGVTSILRAIDSSDVIIVDELGPMELYSTSFVSAVEKALKSEKPLVGTIHKRASHDLVRSIRANPSYEIVEVTKENRDLMPDRIGERLTIQA